MLPGIISGYDPLGPALYPTLLISAKMSRFFKNICQPRIVIFTVTYLLASLSPTATTLMKRPSESTGLDTDNSTEATSQQPGNREAHDSLRATKPGQSRPLPSPVCTMHILAMAAFRVH